MKGRMQNKRKTAVVCLLAGLTLGQVSLAAGQTGQIDDPLLRVLIKKGILTADEAVQVQAEAKALEEADKQEMVKAVEEKGAGVPKGLKDLSIGMLAYVDYSNGQKPLAGGKSDSFNQFSLTRGYLNIKKQLTPWFGVRYTPDITQDDTGDYKFRTKYLYGEFKPGDLGLLTDIKSEVGIGHIPWLDFEEHINPYRCQGTMPIERAGTFNSADAGVSLMGDLGGKLADAEVKTGSHYYNGQYGSWHVGVYNGSGYHAKENNNNKAVEGRLTIRPLPADIPGLQLSYFGIYGEGNKEYNGEIPDYIVNLGMLSYQHPWFTVTGQYFTTQGNAKGTWVDAKNDALATAGYSLFGDMKLPVLEKKLSVFGRWDHFDADADEELAPEAAYDLCLAGLVYDVYKGNLMMLAYETTDYEDDFGPKKGDNPIPGNNLGDDHKVQIVYQLKF